ncbi:hypothetical protein [Desulfopila sp. IMCC35008]|uniref:hypothetical protein n=1 Tax=Desulfopila sp. IMCC35008 TaxID=2653858 RepID=UPI0013D72484|nr:hypothetical protein [Desulfopila sp. IMCC35008]
MSNLKKILIAVLFGFLSLTVVSCDQKGPAEKVGENIDKGIEKTGETIEKAGKAVEEAGEKVNEKIKDAKQ